MEILNSKADHINEELNNLNSGDKRAWRSLLLRRKYLVSEIEEQKKITNDILTDYNNDIKKRAEKLDYIDDVIQNNIQAIGRKTKSGTLKVDHFPDLPTVSYSVTNRVVPGSSWLIKEEFQRHKTEFNRSAFNARYKFKSGHVVDIETGEVAEDVTVESSPRLTFRDKTNV